MQNTPDLLVGTLSIGIPSLNDNLDDKQCYFSLDSFSTKRKFKFRLKVSCVLLYFYIVLHLKLKSYVI